jgi:hypothetical protein
VVPSSIASHVSQRSISAAGVMMHRSLSSVTVSLWSSSLPASTTGTIAAAVIFIVAEVPTSR